MKMVINVCLISEANSYFYIYAIMRLDYTNGSFQKNKLISMFNIF